MHNIPLFKVFMSKEAPEEVSKVLAGEFIGQGPKVEQLEAKLRHYLNHDFILTTNSATSAEHLSWLLLNKPFGDWEGLKDNNEILTTPLSCFASISPILLHHPKLQIKWVDLDPNTLNLDLQDLERKITKNTRAIQLVLWGGYPLNFDKVREIQDKTKEKLGFKPVVLIDCAHAFGSKFKGKQITEFGHICTYSFQAIKHLTGVDLGALVVPHQELYRRGKLLRWYGLSREIPSEDFRCGLQDIEEPGTKWHCNDVCATVLLSNLNYANWIINRHKENAKFYDEQLKDISGIKLLERHPDHESSFWIYSMLVENRTSFMKRMKDCGIQVSQVHERLDNYTCTKEFKSHLPVLDSVINKLVHIPVHWAVKKEDREYIIECIKKGW